MFTIEEIIVATKGRLTQGRRQQRVRRVSTDSRAIRRGDLFIAIKGDTFDGHHFISEVTGQGCAAVLVDRPVDVSDPTIAVIVVDDTVLAMGRLAKAFRLRFKIPVIAITGSAGKTTTKEMLAAVLKTTYKVLYNVKSFNNHIGVPLTLFQLKSTHEIVVLECGTNQPGDMAYLADIARPDTVIFTNIGESHLEKLKNLAGVLREKWHLTKFLPRHGKVIYNADDRLLTAAIGRRGVGVSRVKKARLQARNTVITRQGFTQFETQGQIIRLKSLGLHQVLNALLAMACADCYKVSLSKAANALNKFRFPEGRGQFLRHGTLMIINDSYNANPVSMRGAVDLLAILKGGHRRVLVAGDMLELGTQSAALHRSLGTYVADSPIEVLLTAGSLTTAMHEKAKVRGTLEAKHFDTVEQLLKSLKVLVHPHDAILVKGSRRMKMERVVEGLIKT